MSIINHNNIEEKINEVDTAFADIRAQVGTLEARLKDEITNGIKDLYDNLKPKTINDTLTIDEIQTLVAEEARRLDIRHLARREKFKSDNYKCDGLVLIASIILTRAFSNNIGLLTFIFCFIFEVIRRVLEYKRIEDLYEKLKNNCAWYHFMRLNGIDNLDEPMKKKVWIDKIAPYAGLTVEDDTK